MARKLFVVSVFALFIYIVFPFIVPVAMGAVFSVLLIPVLEKLEKKKVPLSLSSVLLTLGFTILVLLPTTFLVFTGAKAGYQQIVAWKDTPHGDGGWIETIVTAPKVSRFIETLTDLLAVDRDKLIEMAQDLARSIGIKAADLLGELLTHLPAMVIGMAVMILSIYFFLVDGRKLNHFLRRNSFFGVGQTDQLIHALSAMCRSVVLASVVSAGSQAIFEGIVCWASNTPNPALIATLVFIASFIPIAGSLPITLGVALQAFIADRAGAGTVLLIAALLVTAIDNFVRPLFLKGATNLHPLLAFLAALGGLQMIGFVGVFLGPIIAALFVVTVEILTQSDASHATDH